MVEIEDKKEIYLKEIYKQQLNMVKDQEADIILNMDKHGFMNMQM
jgi:hypothetical protein